MVGSSEFMHCIGGGGGGFGGMGGGGDGGGYFVPQYSRFSMSLIGVRTLPESPSEPYILGRHTP